MQHPPGTAPVKTEYLLYVKPKDAVVPDDDGAEGAPTRTRGYPRSGSAEDGDARSSRSKGSKEQRKAQRGANKGRKFGKTRDDLELCWKIANGSVCEFGSECRFTHDIEAYLAAKQRDIRIPDISEISDSSPFLEPALADNTETLSNHSSIVHGVKCPVFTETGECRYGFKCRFLGGHVREQDGSLQLVGDEDTKARAALTALEVNFINPEAQRLLRSKKYPCPVAKAYVQQLREMEEGAAKKPEPTAASVIVAEPEQDMDVAPDAQGLPNPVSAVAASEVVARRTGAVTSPEGDHTEVPLKAREKKRLDWAGKTYLAPLTTVGNLPFRRLCVDYGADITCGEMGLASSFLAGSKEEWSLVRRHPSEKIFGVQLAGNKPLSLVSTAEILAKECAGNIDFVDINCGCPIDLVFKTGSGSALLDAPGKLGKIIVGMSKALDGIPVTVKLRTGIKDGKNTAHKLMPRLAAEWGASCITLHGRTRQQRYTKLADWDYIKECVGAVRAREEQEDLPPVPIFGGGDCYSSQDYWSHVDGTGVDGVMIGRGALIKPWIFTEVKEHREWDISARERLDLIKKYAEYGINHFGSDTTGVNATRRYLCEALSFQYRYVPIGLLERLPGRINDRAPAFCGRSDLETLLASSDSQDWVKISEMFLGPAPESWSFTPKHRSNAAGAEESQG